uniref:Uncharacterized protein n=1 Tax=Fagus sylvatica TaxID=28930 RepID=A0A2N9J3C7_FAGSY
MASSSSLNTQEAIDLNDVPSVMHAPSSMPEVWCPYFLSPNGPITVIDSVILNGVTAIAVATGLCTPEDGKCVAFVSNMGRRLHVRNHEVRALSFPSYHSCKGCLRRARKKVGEFKEENKKLVKLVDSYANDLVTWFIK